MRSLSLVALGFVAVSPTLAHIAFWDPSMWGFNVTDHTFPYDNRPVIPLEYRKFNDWWFHGHLGYPPHPEDVFQLPAGGSATAQIACHKGATTFWPTSEGPDVQSGNDPCPGGSQTDDLHTTGYDDIRGCALAIAPKSNVNDVRPEDFAVFSVNHECVWNRFTEFKVPAAMPPCPDGKCICAWFWIHSPNSGPSQMFMNGFQCTVTGSTSTAPIGRPQVARRCGADPEHGKFEDDPANCTVGAKQPLYWLQEEGNNMFEGFYSPPYYNDLYGFKNGAQDDIFVTDGSPASPTPAEATPATPSASSPAPVEPSSAESGPTEPAPASPGPVEAVPPQPTPVAGALAPPTIPSPSPVAQQSATNPGNGIATPEAPVASAGYNTPTGSSGPSTGETSNPPSQANSSPANSSPGHLQEAPAYATPVCRHRRKRSAKRSLAINPISGIREAHSRIKKRFSRHQLHP